MPQLIAGAKKIIMAADAVEKIRGMRQQSNAKKTIKI